MAVALADNRFLYQTNNGNLYIEETRSNGASDFVLLFGGNAIAFALEESKGWMALLLRNDSDVLLRVYSFDGSVLGAQLAEGDGVKVHPKSNTLQWVGDGEAIAVSDVMTGTMVYEWNGFTLCKSSNSHLDVMERNGSHPFSTLQYIGVLEEQNQTIHFYDYQKAKVVESYQIPKEYNNGEKHHHRVVSTSASKNFVLIANEDGTMCSVYVTKGSVRKLLPVQEEFRSPSAAPLQVVSTALSSGQVFASVVPIHGMEPFSVVRYKYIKKQASLVMVERTEVSRPEHSTLLAISCDARCLVRSHSPVGTESFEVQTIPFESVLHPRPSPSVSGSPAATARQPAKMAAVEKTDKSLRTEPDSAARHSSTAADITLALHPSGFACPIGTAPAHRSSSLDMRSFQIGLSAGILLQTVIAIVVVKVWLK